MKPNGLPYLTAGERSMFKRLVEGGQMSFFRLATCENEGCDEDVPKQPESKRFCSKACYMEAEGIDDDADDSQREVD